MSDQNPSDPFDSHPESSGCSNDDFEQLDVPGSGYYNNQYHDNGDADGPEEISSGAFDYDPEQDAQVSTTTANVFEDEAEEDRYAAGASEADAFTTHTSEPLISFDGDEYNNYSPYEAHDPIQPSAPVPDFDSANDFASSTAADILSTIAQSAYPPSGHYAEPISSTSYEDPEFNEPEIEKETGRQVNDLLEADIVETPKTVPYEQPVPSPVAKAEPVSTSNIADVPRERSNTPEENKASDAPKVCFLRGVDPRELEAEEIEETAEKEAVEIEPEEIEAVEIEAEEMEAEEREAEEIEAEDIEEEIDAEEEAVISSQPPFFKDLIYWRDVKTTGIVFGAMLVALLSLALMSVISVVAYLSLAVLAVTFSFVIYKKVMSAVQKSGDGHPFRSFLEKDLSLNEVKLKSIIQTTLKNVNATAKELRHLFLIEDIVDSVKFGILLWALTYIGSWFSDMTLIIIALVLVFTVPKLYETYQVQIDNYIDLAKAQINNYLSIIQSKVPFLKKKEKSQ